jgi:rare lipoprotein A
MLARRVFVLSLAVVALFVVLASFAGPSRAEQLVASWYGVGDGFAGLTTANGETFDPYAYTAAHKTLPFDTKLQVTYGGESVVVRINDRGPYIQGRDLDLSYAAARDIGLVAVGSAPVEVEYVDLATPVGPVQASASAPIQEPAPEPEPEPAPEIEPAEEETVEPAVDPQVSAEEAPEERSASASAQYYPGEELVDEEQYADVNQYREDATADQHGFSGADEPVAEPSGWATPAVEFAPQAEVDTNPVDAEAGPVEAEAEQAEEAPEQPSPATVVPPLAELEEPPEELVNPGTTVKHRVELKIAAAPGTATDSPETPDLAPAPADAQAEEVLVSGVASEVPAEPEADEAEADKPAPEESVRPSEMPDLAPAPADAQAEEVLVSGVASEVPAEPEADEAEADKPAPEESVQPSEEPLPGEDAELQEVDIEVLPDTGGAAKLPGVSLADLAAVLLIGALLRSGVRRLRG